MSPRAQKWIISGPPLVYLLIFFAIPVLIMAAASFRYPGELGGLAPRVARLSAAMQQRDRTAGVAEDVGDETIAVSSGEGFGMGRHQPRHGRSSRNFTTPAL